jgi:hypothetical protein
MPLPVGAPAEAVLPDIDDRLAAPETRYEILDGRVMHVSPADGPHGMRHAQIIQLIGTHVGLEFQVACDMLTRTSEVDDFAPDVSVFPSAPHPETGRRQLEQLAFEVVSTQSLGNAGQKAAKLIGRGVRRVFAIDVERSRLLEWSMELDAWNQVVAPCIEDAALDVPLPVDTLIRAIQADDAIARALLAKHNPVLEAAKLRDREQARIAGKSETLLMLLDARGVALAPAQRARIAEEQDAERLDRWLVRSVSCASAEALFDEP